MLLRLKTEIAFEMLMLNGCDTNQAGIGTSGNSHKRKSQQPHKKPGRENANQEIVCYD